MFYESVTVFYATLPATFDDPDHSVLEKGVNVAILEPDIVKAFVDSAAINDALRPLLKLTRTNQHLTKHSK